MRSDPHDTAIDAARLLADLPRHAVESHKYQRGHTLVVSGGIEATGAARLAAKAALRIGSGLVTVASPASALIVHAASLTAIMVRRFDEAADLAALVEGRHCTAAVIGPGLSPDESGRAAVAALLARPIPMVLDAGALTAFAVQPAALFDLIRGRHAPTILTPHDGEFRRLYQDLEGPRPDIARAAAERSGAVVVLKGRGTVIAAPDGRHAIDRLGPPTLATAGSGDVLSGLIGGLLAQGMDGFAAACAGVTLHAMAALRFGPGLIAEDLEGQVPAVLAGLGVSAP